MISQRTLHLERGLLAALFADGRECAARPVRGTGLGRVAALCVHGTSPQTVRGALDWMPGRALVLADGGLGRACLDSVARSAHLDSLSAIIVLADEGADLGPLGRVDTMVPVVLVPRVSDQEWLRRARRIVVEVQAGEIESVDVRGHHLPRPRRGSGPTVILGAPGTVRH